MSKVNVDEIKVGDLVGFDNYNKKIALCYVTKIDSPVVGCVRYWGNFSCKKDPEREGFIYDYNIDYHWKVINFEEEKQMDELKVYTGEDTLRVFLEGKVLKRLTNNTEYKIEDKRLVWKNNGSWITSRLDFCELMSLEFTEVATPQVGDWVKITSSDKSRTYVGKAEKVSDKFVYANWGGHGLVNALELKNWEILSPEQISEYKREQAFIKVGRKPNEFRSGDIVMIDLLGRLAIVISNVNETQLRLHEINTNCKGHVAKPHQLTPISFVENQVSLD